MDDTILTIEEVAAYLRVSERTVSSWAHKGEIPAGKIGMAWRFKKSEVDRWINSRLSTEADAARDCGQFKNIVAPDRVIFISQPSKQEALVELAETLARAPQVKRGSELVAEILKREALFSTAIGCGIAVPHVRLLSVTDLVMAVGICRPPLSDFQAFDEVPVSLLFMIAAAYSQHAYYLRTLSALSLRLKQKDFRAALTAAKTPRAAYDELCRP
ncbi:MAG: PTS sugar transporter subunit IIA [Treponema sp.]|nr:PTS sugar transporter subunit IIA [Treponema sp.]